MGQYYKAVILGDNKKTVATFLSSYDYDNGAKLMEHSYIGNTLVSAFETLIQDKPQRVVWSGDYADECKGRKTNIYQRCKDSLKSEQINHQALVESPFIINHSKGVFVDKNRLKEMSADWADGMKIHPLPLLTCEGNGRGGGDFFGDEKEIVGSWARDIISVSEKEPEGFDELIFDLDE